MTNDTPARPQLEALTPGEIFLMGPSALRARVRVLAREALTAPAMATAGRRALPDVISEANLALAVLMNTSDR